MDIKDIAAIVSQGITVPCPRDNCPHTFFSGSMSAHIVRIMDHLGLGHGDIITYAEARELINKRAIFVHNLNDRYGK